MHISDGVLPVSVAVGAYALSAAVTAISVKKAKGDDLPKLAVVTASFFVASLLYVPLGPTSVHLLIPGLVGILLGSSAFIAIGLGLTLQCLLFQYGGLTALGANSLMMGIPAVIAGWMFQVIKGETISRHVFAGAVAGGLGTGLAAIILGFLLFLGGEDFLGVAKLALAAHIPVMIVEAAVAAFTVSFLFKVKPDLLGCVFAMPIMPEELQESVENTPMYETS